MSIKSKRIFIFSAIVLLLALAAAVILFGRADGGNYEKKLAEAEKYFDACDYDNAVAIYNRVISDNNKCAEAYAGLADAYFAKDRKNKALEVLQKGAENTDNDEIILDKINELFPDLNYAEASAETEEVSEKIVSETSEAEASETEIITEITKSAAAESASVAFSEAISEAVSEANAITEPESAVTTVPTAATTISTTALTTVTTAPPTTASTTVPTTVPTTATTTASAETEELVFVEIPDFTLMTVDDAYSWCSMNNLYLKVIGSGEKPLSQSPAPGTSVKENSNVIVKCGE